MKPCWLHYFTAHLHGEFVAADAQLYLVRDTKDGERIVLLPNGQTYKLRRGHVSFDPPAVQRKMDEDFAG